MTVCVCCSNQVTNTRVYLVWVESSSHGTVCVCLCVCVCVCVRESDVVLAVVFVLVWTKQSEAGMCIFVFKQRNMKPWKKPQQSVLFLLSFILTSFCFLLSEPPVSVSDFMFMRECVCVSVNISTILQYVSHAVHITCVWADFRTFSSCVSGRRTRYFWRDAVKNWVFFYEMSGQLPAVLVVTNQPSQNTIFLHPNRAPFVT